MTTDFQKVTTPHGTYWVRGREFIRYFHATHVRGEHYQRYVAVEHLPTGKMPWQVDNRRQGGEFGFSTLDQAMA